MAVKKAAGRLKCAGNGIEVSFQAKEKITKNIQPSSQRPRGIPVREPFKSLIIYPARLSELVAQPELYPTRYAGINHAR